MYNMGSRHCAKGIQASTKLGLCLLGLFGLLLKLHASASTLSSSSSTSSSSSHVTGTTYSIHMTVPLTDPTQNAVQIAQWISSAKQSVQDVNARWATTTGNTLELLIRDDEGNSVVAMENAMASGENTTNVVALLVTGTDEVLCGYIARVGRYFKVRLSSHLNSLSLPDILLFRFHPYLHALHRLSRPPELSRRFASSLSLFCLYLWRRHRVTSLPDAILHDFSTFPKPLCLPSPMLVKLHDLTIRISPMTDAGSLIHVQNGHR